MIFATRRSGSLSIDRTIARRLGHVARLRGMLPSPRRTLTDGPPLYGNAEYSTLAMPLQAKAMVAACRHLHDAHGLPEQQLAQGLSVSKILDWHLEAHGVSGLSQHLASAWALI